MEFYKTRIFEERPKWDKSWNENVNYSDDSSEESPANRLDQVEERLSGRDKVESWNHPIKNMLSLKTNKPTKPTAKE